MTPSPQERAKKPSPWRRWQDEVLTDEFQRTQRRQGTVLCLRMKSNFQHSFGGADVLPLSRLCRQLFLRKRALPRYFVALPLTKGITFQESLFLPLPVGEVAMRSIDRVVFAIPHSVFRISSQNLLIFLLLYIIISRLCKNRL